MPPSARLPGVEGDAWLAHCEAQHAYTCPAACRSLARPVERAALSALPCDGGVDRAHRMAPQEGSACRSCPCLLNGCSSAPPAAPPPPGQDPCRRWGALLQDHSAPCAPATATGACMCSGTRLALQLLPVTPSSATGQPPCRAHCTSHALWRQVRSARATAAPIEPRAVGPGALSERQQRP